MLFDLSTAISEYSQWKNGKIVKQYVDIDLCEYKNITCNFMQTFTEAARSNKMSK